MPSTKRKPVTVYVIMHYEYFEGGHIDCLQFHVASSLKKAEAYFKIVHVDPHSWWQVHPHVIDHNPKDGWEGEEFYYYSYRGKRLKEPPHQQARKAWEKEHQKRKRLGWYDDKSSETAKTVPAK
jgi:hypothetical protein